VAVGIAAATVSSVTLDSPVTLTGGGHTLAVVLPNGAIEVKGSGKRYGVDSAGGFTIQPSASCRCNMGVAVTEPTGADLQGRVSCRSRRRH